MKHLKYSLLLLAVGVLGSCVRDPQDIAPVTTSNPVFFADLLIGQDNVKISAGENGYVMHTEHFTDHEGVTHYLATFQSSECGLAFCPSLEFEFFDNQVVSHPESGVEHTFVTGQKGYYNAEDDGDLDITFFLGQGQIDPGISYWTTGMDTLTTNQVEITSGPNAYFDLCFHHEGEVDCAGQSAYCFHTLASSPFIGVLKADRSFGEYIVVEVDLQGAEPYNYTWMTGATTPFILLPAQDGEVDVTVHVTDATLSTIEISQTVRIEDGTARTCGGTPLFVYTVSKAPFSQFSSVIVRYTDAQGTLYSTSYGSQINDLFRIREVSDFGTSPQGFSTKEIHLDMHGLLYSADGSHAISVTGNDIAVAISYGE